MKKFPVYILCTALALSLAACGGQAAAGQGSAPAESTAVSEPAAAPADTDTKADTGTAPGPAAAPSRQTDGNFQAAIEETVLVDEKDVKITATELRYTSYSVELALAFENNSGKDLSFRSSTIACSRNSVNGYMVDGLYVNVDVPAGKKANDTASIGKNDLLLYGITDIADIEMAFAIEDDNYDDYLLTEPARVTTALAESYDYEADPYQAAMRDGALVASLGGAVEHFAADELYDAQGVRIVSEAFITNADGEPVVFVEFENTSDRLVTVTTNDVALNGLLVQNGTWSYDTLNAGTRRVVALQPDTALDRAYWEPYGLDTVGEIAFSLVLKDADGNELCDAAPVTLTLPGAEAACRSDGDPVYSGGGVRILHMGTVPDSYDASDDLHLLLLAENGTEGTVRFDIGYDTLSVNGCMTDFSSPRRTVAPGGSGVLDVELQGDSLAENGITAAEDIQTVEFTVELKGERNRDIASFTVVIGENGQPAQEAAGGTDAAAAPGVSPDFKEVMDGYEAFFDEYAAFMKKYQSSDNAAGMMMDYLSFMTRYTETMQKLDELDTDSLSAADMAYYTQVTARITAKLAEAAG